MQYGPERNHYPRSRRTAQRRLLRAGRIWTRVDWEAGSGSCGHGWNLVFCNAIKLFMAESPQLVASRSCWAHAWRIELRYLPGITCVGAMRSERVRNRQHRVT